MQSDIFEPNAFVVLKPKSPIFFKMFDVVKDNIIISSIGLRWNSLKNRVVNSSYRILFDYLMEGLPLERKFKGGLFFAQIHEARLTSWDNDPNFDLAASFFRSFKKVDSLCAKNLRITVGKYAGDDLKSAIASRIALQKRKTGA